MNEVKISFGIIVLNGEPFTRYTLRALYPFAHQIIVVEGAAPGAAEIALPDGHSNDDTLKTIRDFQEVEDVSNKVLLVTAEDEGHANGFWPGEKDEQSQAYAKRATGNYLWQVDVDEFYKREDMEKVIQLLETDRTISTVTFKQITFWGSLETIVDGFYLRSGATCYHRLFEWGKGYHYVTHRPPTVTDAEGVDCRTKHWVDGKMTEDLGITLYHYSLLFPKQVAEKCSYYQHADWAKRTGATLWAENTFMKLKQPFRVHNVFDYLSWLEPFDGCHPVEIQHMWKDIQDCRLKVDLRKTQDIKRLLNQPFYRMIRWLLQNWANRKFKG